MSIRRFMGHKKKDVCEIITSSKTWVVPAGVTKVDLFLVGGGSNGGRGTCCNGGGYGGRGGEVKTYTNIPVTPGASIPIHICMENKENKTYFQSSSSYYAQGYYNNYFHSGNGNNGVGCTFPGLPLYYSYRMGAGGGAGSGNTQSGRYYGGIKGGGNGAIGLGRVCPGDSPLGDDASYYGGGGGGSGESCGSGNESTRGGYGYQGIAIIHYIK